MQEYEPRQLERAADVLKALGHPVRIRVIDILAGGEYTVGDLTDLCGCSQSMMSQQLRILVSHNLVRTRKSGTAKYCALNNPNLTRMLECVFNHLHKQADANR